MNADTKGILMQRERISDVQAFNLLISTSQNANIKLHDLAAWLVDTPTTPRAEPTRRVDQTRRSLWQLKSQQSVLRPNA
jgi:hypothetical protein